MKHELKDFEIGSVFRWDGYDFRKHSERWAKQLFGDGEMVYFHDENEWMEIISGQSRLKVGAPLYNSKGDVIGHCQERPNPVEA